MSIQHTTPIGRPRFGAGHRLVKRLLDITVAVLLILPASPIILLLFPWIMADFKARIRSGAFVGPGGRRLQLKLLCLPLWLADVFGQRLRRLEYLPRLFALCDGRLTLVGPRPVAAGELDLFGGLEHPRFGVVPGLVCLWWLRQRSNIDYGSESDADLDYVKAHSLRQDIAILARSLIALAYGPAATSCAAGHFICGIRLVNLSMDNLLDAIVAALGRKARTRIAFVNPDCANIAARDARYRLTLNKFDWVCADGIGMKIAGSLLGRPVRQNLNGTDLFPRLCATLSKSGHSLYMIGAQPGVAQGAADWALARYPGLIIAGTRSGYFSSTEEDGVLAAIKASGADVLLVAMGAPRQEIWLECNLEATGAVVGMGVGGLFDFYSGRIPRAPLWLREIGGEWAYRLLQEPGRMWRRYLLGNWIFLYRIFVEKFSGANMQGPAK